MDGLAFFEEKCWNRHFEEMDVGIYCLFFRVLDWRPMVSATYENDDFYYN